MSGEGSRTGDRPLARLRGMLQLQHEPGDTARVSVTVNGVSSQWAHGEKPSEQVSSAEAPGGLALHRRDSAD